MAEFELDSFRLLGQVHITMLDLVWFKDVKDSEIKKYKKLSQLSLKEDLMINKSVDFATMTLLTKLELNSTLQLF